ncbi:MAG TPA: molybdopterin-dependent oxidoreductase [Dehalococcoidia bacterium]|nr:molybdopterin-dependent oxidoreductase [Dehalococcoidia bacterium]
MPTRFLLLLCAFGLILGLAACSKPGKSDFPRPIIPASINPGDPIPAPSGEVILTISGNLSVTNVGDSLQLDMPTLERLGLVKYSVLDPYLNKDTAYTGLLMSDLARVLGVTEPAEVFHFVALDDYQVELTLAQVQRWPILLATRANDEYMSVENSGPTRIIFPYDTHPELNPIRYNDLWIWNIESIKVD